MCFVIFCWELCILNTLNSGSFGNQIFPPPLGLLLLLDEDCSFNFVYFPNFPFKNYIPCVITEVFVLLSLWSASSPSITTLDTARVWQGPSVIRVASDSVCQLNNYFSEKDNSWRFLYCHLCDITSFIRDIIIISAGSWYSMARYLLRSLLNLLKFKSFLS